MSKELELIIFALGAIVFLFLFFGLIGPNWLKRILRRYNIWVAKWLNTIPDKILPRNPYRSFSKRYWVNITILIIVGLILGFLLK